MNLMQGDCLERMKEIENGSVDLTVTSPPYDNLRSYKGSLEWGEQIWKPIIKDLFRITKKGGVVVWVVGDATLKGSETGTSFKQALYAMECGFNLHDTMIFKKTNPIPQIYRKRYNAEFEYMFVFSKDYPTTHNPIRVKCKHAGKDMSKSTAKNYNAHGNSRTKQATDVKDTKIKGNVWDFVVGKMSQDQEAKGHPAPFPCMLAHDHIISWSNEGDTVFDPFMGSGTTGKMAVLNGRDFIGIEKVEEYFNIATERIEKAYKDKHQEMFEAVALVK